jgi:hypothetical protein
VKSVVKLPIVLVENGSTSLTSKNISFSKSPTSKVKEFYSGHLIHQLGVLPASSIYFVLYDFFSFVK